MMNIIVGMWLPSGRGKEDDSTKLRPVLDRLEHYRARFWRTAHRAGTLTGKRLERVPEGRGTPNVGARNLHLKRLTSEIFDVLVIGGGATGSGIALDAATRGLKVALVERFDFGSGTSSRSTKLVHGGVRYLEQAVRHADRSQFHLVREALKERATLLANARHLAHPLPLLTPIYGALELPYYFTGLKLYDMLAGRANLSPSRLINRDQATERSEEHTSELQSRPHLVCRLLLEKKK